jgi:hypothetical protein
MLIDGCTPGRKPRRRSGSGSGYFDSLAPGSSAIAMLINNASSLNYNLKEKRLLGMLKLLFLSLHN